MSRLVPLTLFLALLIFIGLISSLDIASASRPTERDRVRNSLVSFFSSDNSTETYLNGFSGLQGIAIGDFNNDGLNEIAVSDGPADTVTVCKSNGTIVKQFTGVDNPFGVAVGDLNNDGLNEIAFAETNSSRVTVCKSDGTVVKQFLGLSQPTGVAIGDFENIHVNEIAIAEAGSGTVVVCKSDGTVVKQFLGLSQPTGVAIGDFENIHVNEIAIAEAGSGTVVVCKSDGTVVKQFSTLSQPMGVAIGDYDNSGLNEIAITETYSVGKVTVYKSDGTTVVRNWTSRNNPTGVAIGDIYNNGKNELAFTEVSQLTIEPIFIAAYNVTFIESGLPAEVGWWVNLSGDNQSSTSNAISFSLPNGMYTYSTGASGYNSTQSTIQLTVNGSNMNEQVTFTTIPEFPSPFILSVFIPAILLATIITRQRKITKLREHSDLRI